MSRVLTFTLVALVVSASVGPLPDDAPLLTDEEIDAINAAGLWVADKSLIEGKTLGDLRRHRQQRHVSTESLPEHKWGALLDHLTLPANFDARSNWPGCVHAIQNENDCIGSWAMAAADVLSDRFCIQARTQVTLSPQYLLNCQSIASGCEGGTAIEAWTYLASNGAPTLTCTPFTGNTGSCPTRCASGTSMANYKSSSPLTYVGIQNMQTAIQQGGSIESCFQMYSDFQAYRSGIYVHTSGSYIDVECVKLVGWASANSITYWIGAAYFGTGWGQSGFFYMKMGQLGIEAAAFAGNPSS